MSSKRRCYKFVFGYCGPQKNDVKKQICFLAEDSVYRHARRCSTWFRIIRNYMFSSFSRIKMESTLTLIVVNFFESVLTWIKARSNLMK